MGRLSDIKGEFNDIFDDAVFTAIDKTEFSDFDDYQKEMQSFTFKDVFQ